MKILLFLPTKNERTGLAALLRELESVPGPDMSVLVVDGESVDGTTEWARGYRGRRLSVEVVSDPDPGGRGCAGRAAFEAAHRGDVDILIEMDADGSHDPSEIPMMLDCLGRSGADLVIGSRRAEIWKTTDWPLSRRLFSVVGNAIARRLLRVPVWDCNSGFRCYSRKAITMLAASGLEAVGSDIVHETLANVHRAGGKVVEAPITFRRRTAGQSTKRAEDFFRALRRCWMLRYRG